VQKRGFQVTGTTLYDAQRMRKDVPTLTLILQSFHPTEVQGRTTNSSRRANPGSVDPVSPVRL